MPFRCVKTLRNQGVMDVSGGEETITSHLLFKNSLLSHLPPKVISSVLVVSFQAFIFPDVSYACQGVCPASDFDKYLRWSQAAMPLLPCSPHQPHPTPLSPTCDLPGGSAESRLGSGLCHQQCSMARVFPRHIKVLFIVRSP